MNVVCPSCETVFRVDPERIPDAGVRARCSRCDASFRLTHDGVAEAAAVGAAPEPAAATTPTLPFGPSDPGTRAKRIARALVSDIVAYHADRLERSRAGETLRADFREEILKSWEEYVEQVGVDMAKRTPYFRDALNEILARGQPVF